MFHFFVFKKVRSLFLLQLRVMILLLFEVLAFALVGPLSFRSTKEQVSSLPEVPVSCSSTYLPLYNYVCISCTYVCDLAQMKG